MKIDRYRIHIRAAILLLMLVPSALFAASVKEMDLSELVNSSDRVVVGECISVTTEWSGGKIYSRNTIQVQDSVKGQRIASYVVTTLGGTAFHPQLNTEVTMDVSGGLRFRPNQELVLFTKENALGQHQVVGMSQGKFEIVTDKNTGERVVPVAEIKNKNEKLARDLLSPNRQNNGLDQEQTVISQGNIGLDKFVNKIRSKVEKEQKERN